jgi:hypothetical protein
MITLVSAYQTDLELAINWLMLNKVVKDLSPQKKEDNLYIVHVKLTISKTEAQKLVSSKFGRFVKVIE